MADMAKRMIYSSRWELGNEARDKRVVKLSKYLYLVGFRGEATPHRLLWSTLSGVRREPAARFRILKVVEPGPAPGYGLETSRKHSGPGRLHTNILYKREKISDISYGPGGGS
jgi:hypothetical protein